MKNNTKNIRKGITAILFAAMMMMAVLAGAVVGIETIDASSVSSCGCIVPEGFKAEVFAVKLEGVEDFTFDSSGNLFVGGGGTGKIKEIDFDDDTPLPIDAGTIDPVIVGLHAVFGLPFDESGDMFVSEFDNGEITKIAFPLPEPLPFDAGTVSPLAYLTCPDGMAFAPPGSAFGTELFVGDVKTGGIFKVSSVGTVTPFASLDCDIEEVIFSNSGDLLFAISPGSGKIYSISPDESANVIAKGFAFPDAIAQGPGNAFGEYLYVGDLRGKTLFRVDPETGKKSIFATFGSEFKGFEDIIFDSEGNMFVLGFGRSGQIIKISPTIIAGIEIKPETLDLNSKGLFTAFITLPESYNIADIDISTVVCEGAPAVKGMVANDNKYIAKFDREDLRDDLTTGDAVTLTVTGKLYDGTVFEGSDTVRVIDK